MNAITLDRNPAALSAIADRLGNPIGRGTRIVYARGNLPVLCGQGRVGKKEITPVEAAYRAVRAAAWDAYERGRVSLVQRHIETNDRGHQVFEYIAEGLR